MTHVLFITPSFTPFVGGTTAFVAAVARRLAADGHTVTILTTNARRAADFWQPPSELPLPAAETLEGVTVERLSVTYPPPAPYAFGMARRAGHWLARSPLPAAAQRPTLRRLAQWMPPLPGLDAALARLVPAADVIHAIEASWDGLFTAAAAAAGRAGKPFVAMPLLHLGDAGVQAHFQMAHQVEAYRAAQAVLALSPREAEAYACLGVEGHRIHTISMGVESAHVPGTSQVPGTSSRIPRVTFLGANTYDKGAFTLALAVAELNRAGLPVSVAFAGPGREGLEAFLAHQPAEVRAALADRVQVLGLVDEPAKHQLLASSTLLALPSQVDTFGIVILEAWQHGRPVIGARAGGIPDLVQDGGDGLLVPFGDVAALAAAIRRLVSDPTLADRLGAAGRERVGREFTLEHTYRKLAAIYVSLCA